MKCDDCAHVFIDGYFNEAALQRIFSKTHDNQKVGYEVEKQRFVSAGMVEKVLPYQDSGAWLDIGFGNGSLLFTAQEYGFHPVGVDLRSENVAILKKYGFEAYCEDVQKIDFNRKFSVVSMMDVLEHVPYPKEMLETVSDLLVDGGVVLVSMPNTESLIWRLMTEQKKNPYLGEIEHYHNFSRSRLYALLSEFSLSPLRYGISRRYQACMEVVARKE
ncbi:MAG: class I SAM-dependent methyltransferase [Paracoccaceae bacterium]